MFPSTIYRMIDKLAAMITLLLIGAGVGYAGESEVARSDHVEARLVSEQVAVAPGSIVWVGLHMQHAPHWHTYWVNPADSGLETMIRWELPDGFIAGEVHWPYPEKLSMGPLTTYGFERDVLLMVPIEVPTTVESGESVTLHADVDWLECKVECIPGSGSFELTLLIAESPRANDAWQETFDQARREWPLEDAGWTFEAFRDGADYLLLVVPPEDWDRDVGSVAFFARDPELVEYGADQQWRAFEGGFAFHLPVDQRFDRSPESIRGVLVADRSWTEQDERLALWVEAPVSSEPPPQLSDAGVVTDEEGLGLGLALLFAFIGGVVLNLMPCVFPVISMKIMGFVQQAEESHAQVFKHGLLFGFGIVVSFWVLAGLLIALRAGGEQLGWGFHLQSPLFLFVISILFFLLGLNLFGVFEVGTSWMGLGQKASTSSGGVGSFFSGAVATLIATPCTAPFMGAALGYALTLSAAEAMAIFSLLGIGMAFPYVLLSAYPGWLSRIPKPGPWMESFKQALGWVFLLFVVYLLKVLEAMTGGPGLMLFIYAAVAVGIGAWILGRWGAIAREPRVRYTGRALAILFMVVGVGVGAGGLRFVAPEADGAASVAREGGMPWEPFSPERYDELRASGTPFFINFTAAWCTVCQVNERLTFSAARVINAFEEFGVVPLKADWTQRDDVIEGVLAGYGRSSVPFYVLYGSDPEASPATLPEMLRPGLVIRALEAMFE